MEIGSSSKKKEFAEQLSGINQAKFQQKCCSDCRLGVKNVLSIRQHFTFEKKKDNVFLAASCQYRDYDTKMFSEFYLIDTRKGLAFSNKRTFTGNM